MAQPWDLVFFTGSGRVGKIIARAAADTLTPVVLELGGKSPVVVDKDLPDLTTMANRIAWGKTINAGQTCVAPDYMVCHKDQVENVSKAIVSRLDFMFGKDPSQSDFSRIVSTQHAQVRLGTDRSSTAPLEPCTPRSAHPHWITKPRHSPSYSPLPHFGWMGLTLSLSLLPSTAAVRYDR
mmetsp:Transcript_23232/g.62264  ORF Transcript_23232/g.62264 Transcript_23232/m.62264 type:complete len:180 (+) Transcript_23232:507-1046(+)